MISTNGAIWRVRLVLCVAVGSLLLGGVGSAQTPGESPLFRIDREAIPAVGELITVFGRLDPDVAASDADQGGVALVSVLRDTLGDVDPENDRLRYVWVHGYTRPSTMQRIASAVPFLNWRTGNKTPSGSSSLPPYVIDLGSPARELWRTALWTAAQYVFFDPYGALAKSSVRAFRRNGDDYRQAHVIRALAILALYEAESGEPAVLNPTEMRDIRARLVLAQKTFGGIIDDGYLQRVHEKEVASTRDVRGHNWELLRQRVEAEGLHFDPLTMPDGDTTHALVWVARGDVERDAPFDRRFLNISSPWGDKRLRDWRGFTETRYFDDEHRPVPEGTPGARAVELIPLALYGLDHPKIPALLVDFRDHGNPKRREMSRRVLHDVTRNILSLSPWGDVQYFVGRSVYNFVTGRRGMDINQPSRLRSYSQLKLLLSLNESLDPALATHTGDLLERVSMNPLQNDLDVETALARESYAALVAAARKPGGELARRVERERRAEFARLEHGRTARVFLRVASVATLGLYRHQEEDPIDAQLARIDVARRLAYHRRFLNETLAGTPLVEVTANLSDVRRSLAYLVAHGSTDDTRTVNLALRLFERTQDAATQRLTVESLGQIETPAARRALLRIFGTPGVSAELRAFAREQLGMPASDMVDAGGAIISTGVVGEP